MNAKQVNIAQGSPEWHEWRRKGIGASDVAALFGLSPYKTARDLFMEKMGFGEVDEEDKSFIFQRGHEAEAQIRSLFKEHTNIDLEPTCFEKGFFLASLDGYLKGTGTLEAKLVGKEVLKRLAQLEELPKHHEIQVQSQLFTSEEDKTFYGAVAPKVKGGVIVEVGRNEKLIKEIEIKGEQFQEALATGKIPDLTAQDIKFITDPVHRTLFEEYAVIKKKKSELDAQLESLESQVKSLADHPKVQCGEVYITSYERAGNIQYAKVPELQGLTPEYLDQFRAKAALVKSIRLKKEA